LRGLSGSEGKEDEEYKFFDSPWLALVKTSAMFVGELEFSDLPIGKLPRILASQWEQRSMPHISLKTLVNRVKVNLISRIHVGSFFCKSKLLF
jgi:hypothetical protein